MRRVAVDDRRPDEFAQLGVDPEVAREWIEQQEPHDADMDEDGGPPDGTPGDAMPGDPLLIWPQNWRVHRLFLRLQTQWKRKPNGDLAGLDYPAVDVTMRMMGLKNRAVLFEELQDMEFAAVTASQDLPVE